MRAYLLIILLIYVPLGYSEPNFSALLKDYEVQRDLSFEQSEGAFQRNADLLVEYAVTKNPDDVIDQADALIKAYAVALKLLHNEGLELAERLTQNPTAHENFTKANDLYYTARGLKFTYMQSIWVAAINSESLTPATENYKKDSKTFDLAMMMAMAHITETRRALGLPNLIDKPEMFDKP